MRTENSTVILSVKVEPDLKNKLNDAAKLKGMDLSKLSRAILTNYVKPGTFTL